MGYNQHCEIWHGASLGTLIMIWEEPIQRSMCGPSFGHKKGHIWAISRKRGLLDTPRIMKFGMEHPGPHLL